MNVSCIVASVKSGTAQKKEVTQGVINVTNSPVITLIISRWLSERRSFLGQSHIDDSLVLKNGFGMKKPSTCVHNAEIKFFAAQ